MIHWWIRLIPGTICTQRLTVFSFWKIWKLTVHSYNSGNSVNVSLSRSKIIFFWKSFFDFLRSYFRFDSRDDLLDDQTTRQSESISSTSSDYLSNCLHNTPGFFSTKTLWVVKWHVGNNYGHQDQESADRLITIELHRDQDYSYNFI